VGGEEGEGDGEGERMKVKVRERERKRGRKRMTEKEGRGSGRGKRGMRGAPWLKNSMEKGWKVMMKGDIEGLWWEEHIWRNCSNMY
jgi:ribosomal protein L15